MTYFHQGLDLSGEAQAKRFAHWINTLESGMVLFVRTQPERAELRRNLKTMKRIGWINTEPDVYLDHAVKEGTVQPGMIGK